MAEVVMKTKLSQLGLEEKAQVYSRASDPYDTGMHMDSRALEALSRRGYDPQAVKDNFISILLSQEDLDTAHAILCMDQENLTSIEDRYGRDSMDAVSLLGDEEILDPWYNGKFEEVLSQIEEAIDRLIQEEF